MTLPQNVADALKFFYRDEAPSDEESWLKVIRAHLMNQEAEIARLARDNERLDASESQLIGERDRAQDALQKTHIELGGDGEWTCKMGAAADYPPNSGDLHDDVPVLAAEVLARSELAESRLAAANAQLRLMHRVLSQAVCVACADDGSAKDHELDKLDGVLRDQGWITTAVVPSTPTDAHLQGAGDEAAASPEFLCPCGSSLCNGEEDEA